MVLFRFRFSAMFAIMLLLLSSLCLHSQDFVDCRFSPCKLLDSAVVQVKEDTKVAYMTLPKNFLVTVDYYFDTIPYEASQTGSQQLQNVYEMGAKNEMAVGAKTEKTPTNGKTLYNRKRGSISDCSSPL